MVNHSKWFKDPHTGVHTNGVEGAWGSVKLNLRKHKGIKEKFLPLYIDEYMFFQTFVKKSKQSPWIVIAKCVGVYFERGMFKNS